MSRVLPPLVALCLAIPATALGQSTPDIPAPPPEQPAPAPAPAPAAAQPAAEAPPAPQPTAPERAAPARRNAAPEATLGVAAPTSVRPPRERKTAGRLAVTPTGETGLLRVHSAESVAPGLIRVGFGLDFFSVGGFFRDNDGASRFGATLSVSGSPIDYLELWLNTRALSNSNDFTQPRLLQSQGDLSLGVKGFYPVADIATVGADLQLTFLSGVGESSFDFNATQLRARALITTDLMRATEQIPVRGHLNIGFLLDNSGNLVDQPLTNAERFALGISDFHRFELGVGVEAPFKYVTPFLEYSVEFPLSYLATPGVVVAGRGLSPAQTTAPPVADAIARPAYQRVVPQRITPGLRITAIPKLTLDVAVEIGITPDVGTGVLATPPYNVVFMASYPLDPFGESGGGPSGPPISVPVLVPEVSEAPKVTGQIVGLVKSKDTQKPIDGAIITFDRATPVATAESGRFASLELEAGPVRVTVKKQGYKPGTAELEIGAGEVSEIEVALVPELLEGIIRGRVADASGKPVAAQVRLVGSDARVNVGADGSFEVTAKAGKVQLVAEKAGFLSKGRSFTLEAGQSVAADLVLRPRPASPQVERKGDLISTKDKIPFDGRSATLGAGAEAMLDEVVDLLLASQDIRKLRVEGHTDNSGAEDANLKLSRERAEAVANYLTAQGIDPARVSAEGFGSGRPIVPNLTRRGRDQNLRVDLRVVE